MDELGNFNKKKHHDNDIRFEDEENNDNDDDSGPSLPNMKKGILKTSK